MIGSYWVNLEANVNQILSDVITLYRQYVLCGIPSWMVFVCPIHILARSSGYAVAKTSKRFRGIDNGMPTIFRVIPNTLDFFVLEDGDIGKGCLSSYPNSHKKYILYGVAEQYPLDIHW
jgi:hypothetical protein